MLLPRQCRFRRGRLSNDAVSQRKTQRHTDDPTTTAADNASRSTIDTLVDFWEAFLEVHILHYYGSVVAALPAIVSSW